MAPSRAGAVVVTYNALKIQAQTRVWAALRADPFPRRILALTAAGGGAVRLEFDWQLVDRRRDPDGIAAGGAKIILDALQPTHPSRGPGAGVIHCDGCHCVTALSHEFTFGVSRESEGVWVRLLSVERFIPGRLPDLNELLAAREAGARTMIARAAARRSRR